MSSIHLGREHQRAVVFACLVAIAAGTSATTANAADRTFYIAPVIGLADLDDVRLAGSIGSIDFDAHSEFMYGLAAGFAPTPGLQLQLDARRFDDNSLLTLGLRFWF